MPIREPESNLWTDVKPRTTWPCTDEELTQDLARAWGGAGSEFERTGAQPSGEDLQHAWNDSNGRTFSGKFVELHDLVFGDGVKMTYLGWLTSEYGFDIGHTKLEIRKVIEANDDTYDKMSGFFGLFADLDGRNALVDEIATNINRFLELMAERIAARGRGEVAPPRPAFVPRREPASGDSALADIAIPPFPNQLPKSLAEELRTAERLGVKPIAPDGTQAFDNLINTGEKLKWAVLEDGTLVVVPKYVQGVEISHSVLSRGAAVRAAGEAEIAGAGGRYYGLSINNHSGHFRPSAESLEIGRELFRRYGIEFG
jgi:hypothetical protein